MRSRSEDSGRILDRFLEELGEPLPSTVRVRRASNRVLENLSSMAFVEAGETAGETNLVFTPQVPKYRWMPVAAVAAALFAAAVLVGTLSLPGNAQPIAKRLNGKLIAAGDTSAIRAGQVIGPSSSGEVLALQDGSRMEMSSGVELSIDRAADGIQIDLAEGNIIVTAAKQHDGHLYVKTRDCVVSVVGTVFSVKAEASGSRVAVIEGEVRVQQGDVSQTLLPGQQVSTNSTMKTLPLRSEIEWSQDAVSHIAMLQQPPAPPVASQIGNTVANPDLVGELRLLLAPVVQGDAGDTVKNKAVFDAIWAAQRRDAESSRAIPNWTSPPNGFTFSVSGVQGRTVSFTNSKGETFSYGCADCSFVVSETGVAKVVAVSEPGVEFKLSADGSTLTATCHAARCSLGRWVPSLNWATRGGAPNTWGASITYLISQTDPSNPQTFTIPASQLTSQQSSALLFVVTK